MIDFDEVFRPTKEQRIKQIEFLNSFIQRSLEKGESCDNCKHIRGFNAGHGHMEYYCKITCKQIDESVKCKNYEFCGFLKE